VITYARRVRICLRAVVETFGAALRRLRSQAGLTQPQLARVTYMAQSTISRLESGSYPLSVDSARRLDDALGSDELVDIALHAVGVDVATLDELSRLVSVNRRLEDESSAASVLPTIRRCVALAEKFAIESAFARRPVAVTAASEISQYCGWLEFATGNARRADQCLDRAVSLAVESDNPDMLSQGLSFRAYFALERGHLGEAGSLTSAALRGTRTHPLLRVYDHFQLARVHALSGDAREAQRVLRAADRAAEAAERESPPEHGYWYTSGFWGLERGRVLWLLGQEDRAISEVRSGLTAMPAEHRSAEWAAQWAQAARDGDLSDVS
jgi:transcriptional regulator with XRE-family HTH domain